MSSSKKNFCWNWIVAFAALVALFSGLAALLPHFDFTVVRSLLIVFACISAAFAYAWRQSERLHLPPEVIERAPRCRLQCPADGTLTQQSHELACEAYPRRIEPINIERYEQWLLKNPNVLVCLTDEWRQVVGYFDVFPITTEFAKLMLSGLATEHDMRHEHIIAPKDIAQCKWLYLGGIAVKDPDTFFGRRSTAYLLWGLRMYLRDYYKLPSDRTVIATGASPQGEQLLRRFHFTFQQSKNSRNDKQNLYVASLANQELLTEMKELPDWRTVCQISWRLRKTAHER